VTTTAVGRPWLFDVDGCLVDLTSATTARPMAAEILAALAGAGVPVIIWSAGGADYARRAMERVGLDSDRLRYEEKVRGADGRWALGFLSEDEEPVVCVDDDLSGVPVGVRAIGVRPFIGPMERDSGLAAVLSTAQGEVAG